jgi:hypothetical protein
VLQFGKGVKMVELVQSALFNDSIALKEFIVSLISELINMALWLTGKVDVLGENPVPMLL